MMNLEKILGYYVQKRGYKYFMAKTKTKEKKVRKQTKLTMFHYKV